MKTEKKSVQIYDFKIRTVSIPIEGISPLLVHKFSEKAKREMEDKRNKAAKTSKHDNSISKEEICEQAKHISPEGWEGFPAVGFKASMIRGAKICGMVMTDTRTGFFIIPDCYETQLVRINGKSRLNEDIVRVSNGAPDIRWRPEYLKWDAVLNVEYNEGMISIDQLFQIIKAAGYGVGIGEKRPEKGAYSNGRFKLTNENE
jgi:hypothetical protein